MVDNHPNPTTPTPNSHRVQDPEDPNQAPQGAPKPGTPDHPQPQQLHIPPGAMGQSPSTGPGLQRCGSMETHAGHPSCSSSSRHSSSLNLSSSPHCCLLLKCQMKQHQMEASRSPAESNGRRAFPHGLCGRAAITPVANPASPPGSACSRTAHRAPQTKPPGFKQNDARATFQM